MVFYLEFRTVENAFDFVSRNNHFWLINYHYELQGNYVIIEDDFSRIINNPHNQQLFVKEGLISSELDADYPTSKKIYT